MSCGGGHQGPQNGTMLHQSLPIPGSGDFLPKFLPKQVAQRSRNIVYAGHSREMKRPARVCYQPSKLVMRVRFPSLAPLRPSLAPLRSSSLVFSVTCPPVFKEERHSRLQAAVADAGNPGGVERLIGRGPDPSPRSPGQCPQGRRVPGRCQGARAAGALEAEITEAARAGYLFGGTAALAMDVAGLTSWQA